MQFASQLPYRVQRRLHASTLALTFSSALQRRSPSTAATSAVSTNNIMAERKVSIQIISDNICPFCYLGKKKIEAAVAKLPPNVQVEYDWRPFELDPTLPTTSVNKMDRYRKKFGADRIEPMLNGMKANGVRWGIQFDFGGNLGNTVNSHRLVEFSKKESQGGGKRTDALINALFASYFEHQGDIAADDTLVACAQKAGLPATEAELRTFLRGDDLRKEVQSSMEDARQADISGVPHFIIDGKYSISGAQEPETFLAIFKKMGLTEGTPAAAASAQPQGSACC